MKRTLAMLLAAVMLTACLCGAVLAAGSATVTVSNVQAKAGQDVAVTFTISECAFANYGMTITYDASVMNLTEVRPGTGYSGLFVPNTENGVVGYANSADTKLSGELFTAVFRVAEDAPDGTYAVGLDMDFIADQDLEDLAVTVVSGSVTVGDTDAETIPPPPEEMTFVPPEIDDQTEPVPPDASVPADAGDASGQAPDADLPAADSDNAVDISAPADNTPLYIAAGVMALALIAIVVILIRRRRTAK